MKMGSQMPVVAMNREFTEEALAVMMVKITRKQW